jgi:hypothetical protein
MRKTGTGVALIAGAALVASPVFAQTMLPKAKIQQINSPASGAGVPNLAPGDDVAIACDAIERVADPSDVHVVLTIAAVPGDTSPGYMKILALDQKVTGSAVHLKVPNAPDLANHTVDLAVYVVNGQKKNDCDGGNYRIVQTPLTGAPAKNPG